MLKVTIEMLMVGIIAIMVVVIIAAIVLMIIILFLFVYVEELCNSTRTQIELKRRSVASVIEQILGAPDRPKSENGTIGNQKANPRPGAKRIGQRVKTRKFAKSGFDPEINRKQRAAMKPPRSS